MDSIKNYTFPDNPDNSRYSSVSLPHNQLSSPQTAIKTQFNVTNQYLKTYKLKKTIPEEGSSWSRKRSNSRNVNH